MKALELFPPTKLDATYKPKSLSITKLTLLVIPIIIASSLLFFGFIKLSLATFALSILGYYFYKVYQEIAKLDFSNEDYKLSLKDIIDDLES